MPAAKKAASKKAPAKAAAPKEEGGSVATIDPKEVVRLRDDEELSFKEIGSRVGVGRSQAEVLYMRGHLSPKDIVKFTDDDDLAAKTVDLRTKQQLSWGQIAARTNVPEGRLRRLFETASGESSKGNRIGKGGRYPGESNGAAAKATTPAKAAKKSTKAAKAADPNPGKKHVADMTLEELKARLEGKTITVGRSGPTKKHDVKSVQKTAKGELHFTDAKGAARVVKLDDIVRASR